MEPIQFMVDIVVNAVPHRTLRVMKRQNLLKLDFQQSVTGFIYFLGKKAAQECFLTHSGQSAGCVQCWIDDMGCAGAQCTLTCISAILRGVPHVVDGKLNDCLACDEYNCGPAFIRCAGANRRRCGITSDIARPAQDHWNRTAC